VEVEAVATDLVADLEEQLVLALTQRQVARGLIRSVAARHVLAEDLHAVEVHDQAVVAAEVDRQGAVRVAGQRAVQVRCRLVGGAQLRWHAILPLGMG